MKTKDFKKTLLDMGFAVSITGDFESGTFADITIFADAQGEKIAIINTRELFSIQTMNLGFANLPDAMRKKLAYLINEYAMTPINERDNKLPLN